VEIPTDEGPIRGHLTTEHARSSHGVPILILDSGQVLGWGDSVEGEKDYAIPWIVLSTHPSPPLSEVEHALRAVREWNKHVTRVHHITPLDLGLEDWFKNPTPGSSIRAYDEHLSTTLDPAFQSASPDEQAAAMTVQDAVENPRKGFWTLARSTRLSSTPPDKYGVVHGPYQLILSDTGAVEILKHGGGRGGRQRLLIKVDRYGTPHWGWVDKDQLYLVPESNTGGEVAQENPMPLRSRLVNAVTEYDRKQEGKRGYNRYAIGHYLGAVDRVMEEVGKGYSVRSAINNNFTGRLADYLLRSVGETPQTRDEQIGPMAREERNPSSDLGQQAFDAGKDFRLSGAYSETGVADTRVAKYGFNKWYNNLPLWGRGPRPTRTHTKARLLKDWMEGWAAGKRVEKRGNPEFGVRVLGFKNLTGRLTTAHAASSYGQPVLVLRGKVYGPGDVYRGTSGTLPPFYLRLEPTGRKPSAYKDLIDRWNKQVAVSEERYRKSLPTHPKVIDWEEAFKEENPESAATALYEDFHGRPPGETKEIITEVHDHGWLTQLGVLVELKVATVTQLDATITFEKAPPDLCSSEDGRQLYIEGGDQSLDLKSLKMSGEKWEKDSMVIGVLYELTYQTEKGFHKFKLTSYFHVLGEETGVQPFLLYDPTNQLLSVSGGQYQIKPEGIIN
jgi:hypothetical protein